MQCLKICNSEVMETELLCDLIELVVSLNVQVSSLFFGFCKQSKLLILVIFACIRSHDLFSVGFFVLSYSHKAARHVCFWVFIGLAAAFYQAFISVGGRRRNVSHIKPTLDLYCWRVRLFKK